MHSIQITVASNAARYERWVRASHKAGAINVWMTPLVQGLGRLDIALSADDEQFLALTDSERSSIDESVSLTDRQTLSQLWVLGAYELVRSIDQGIRTRERLAHVPGEQIKELKRRISRLRVPLAKYEPASRHKSTDIAFALPGFTDSGLSWQTATDLVVSRRELADALLQALESLSSTKQ